MVSIGENFLVNIGKAYAVCVSHRLISFLQLLNIFQERFRLYFKEKIQQQVTSMQWFLFFAYRVIIVDIVRKVSTRHNVTRSVT